MKPAPCSTWRISGANACWKSVAAMDAWQDTYATLHMWMQIVGKKNPAGPEPNGQSLVAGDAVSHRLGADHIAHSVRGGWPTRLSQPAAFTMTSYSPFWL